MSTLIGAVVSIICVVVGWFLGNRESRWKQREETAALGGALLMEILAAAWHILNTHEFLTRAIEEDIVLSSASLEGYMPSPSPIYASAGHEISRLGPVAAQWLVEFYTYLERTMARTRRILALDDRRVKKELRVASLKECVADWGYVAWSGSECMKALLPLTSSSLTREQLDSVLHYSKCLAGVRSGERWSLPDDPTEPTLASDTDKAEQQ